VDDAAWAAATGLPALPACALIAQPAPAPARALQDRGMALLAANTDEDPALAGLDGLHVEADLERFTRLRAAHPDHNIGYGGASRRHEAMLAAENGADYIAFGRLADSGLPLPLNQRLELVTWWAQMMEVPCVVAATQVDEIEPLVLAGADFVAVPPLVWMDEAFEQSVRDHFSEISAAEH